jgi:thioredoxin reductase
MATPQVIVVGSGPAGIRTALELVDAGLRPIVVDEARMSGGQIYRRPPANFVRQPAELYGTEASKAVRLPLCPPCDTPALSARGLA